MFFVNLPLRSAPQYLMDCCSMASIRLRAITHYSDLRIRYYSASQVSHLLLGAYLLPQSLGSNVVVMFAASKVCVDGLDLLLWPLPDSSRRFGPVSALTSVRVRAVHLSVWYHSKPLLLERSSLNLVEWPRH